MRRLPPLNSIRAFEAVARCLSFSAAADELGVTTTAVSHQIRHLESYLGFKLIVRNPRDIALTPAGEEMFPKLRDSFDLLAEAFSVLNSDIEENVLRVTTTRAFADNWLLPRLSGFLTDNPKVQIELVTDDAVRDLTNDRLDVAIRYGVCKRATTDNVILTDQFIAIGRKDIVEQGLSSYPIIEFQWHNKHLDGPVWDHWIAQEGKLFEIASTLSCSDESSALEALDQGLGLLLCSNVLVSDRLAAGTHQQLSDTRLVGFQYYTVSNHASRNKTGTKVFLKWLRDRALEVPEPSAANPSGTAADPRLTGGL